MLSALTISSLFVTDQDEALDFYVGTLGLEVRADVDLGFMRWLTVGVPGDPREVLLERPDGPAHDAATAGQIRELLAKGGTGGNLFFQDEDVEATHAAWVAAGVEITDEPTDRGYGRDFGARDPFGNAIRVNQPVA